MTKKFILLILAIVVHTSLCGQSCTISGQQISVFNWDSSKGSAPRYVAGIADTCNGLGYLILLGYDSTHVYWVEGWLEDDARGGYAAQLIVLDTSGKKLSYPLFNGNQLEKHLESDSLGFHKNQLALSQMWKLCANKTIEPKKVKPLAFKRQKNDSKHFSLQHPLTGQTFTCTFTATPTMCWCYYAWKSEKK